MESSTGKFRTKDNTDIFYSYIEADSKSSKDDDKRGSSVKAAILLHQFKRDHHSYDAFAQTLAKEGISSIAIDFRGHGQSSGKLAEFTDDDFQKMMQDVYSARNFLMLKKKKDIFIIGASIGANTALNFANNNRDIKKIVLLSPGISYHGIDVEFAAVQNRVPTLIFVSEKDDHSRQSSEEIYRRLPLDDDLKMLKVYPGNAHGTDMFQKTDMEIKILRWLR